MAIACRSGTRSSPAVLAGRRIRSSCRRRQARDVLDGVGELRHAVDLEDEAGHRALLLIGVQVRLHESVEAFARRGIVGGPRLHPPAVLAEVVLEGGDEDVFSTGEVVVERPKRAAGLVGHRLHGQPLGAQQASTRIPASTIRSLVASVATARVSMEYCLAMVSLYMHGSVQYSACRRARKMRAANGRGDDDRAPDRSTSALRGRAEHPSWCPS